jgi:hypothetical protein
MDVNANPNTKPKGEPKIKNVSHIDFKFSFAKISAQTGLYIVIIT